MAESLESKARRAVLRMSKHVERMAAILEDVGLKLTYVLERKFDYYTLPKGLDYENGYSREK